MASLWPWLMVAGAGALHGLNPSTGWALAAACGVHSRDARQSLAALLPIAVGHAASIAMVAAMVALGMSMNGMLWQILSGGLLSIVMMLCMSRRRPRLPHAQAGRTGIALWSFMMATAHGTGMMLVPALIPLCMSDSPARDITASGSLLLALAAVGLHTAAMLAVTAIVAWGACGSIDAARRRLAGVFARHTPMRKSPSTPAWSGSRFFVHAVQNAQSTPTEN